MTKKCSSCGDFHDGLYRQCKRCHAAYMRVWRRRRAANTGEVIEIIARLPLGYALCRVIPKQKPGASDA